MLFNYFSPPTGFPKISHERKTLQQGIFPKFFGYILDTSWRLPEINIVTRAVVTPWKHECNWNNAFETDTFPPLLRVLRNFCSLYRHSNGCNLYFIQTVQFFVHTHTSNGCILYFIQTVQLSVHIHKSVNYIYLIWFDYLRQVNWEGCELVAQKSD